ncbi:MAG: Type II secretion system protein E [Parcubacteria group bacterium GW2011_GWC2_49_9]|nr:MAG: Type II secretion system protein E [Parcubacteria group bacterium GW2011_GWA2_48_9]KKW16144.1 MAG: Type II secretion system protein E [Parcubacteria group bacterium GW2011_GWC2_49_9]
MISPEEVKKILLSAKILTEDQLSSTVEKAREKGVALEEYLIDNNMVGENVLYEAIANFLRVPFTDLREQTIRKDILSVLPEAIAQKHHIVVFDKTERDLKVATLDPFNIQLFEFLKKKVGTNISIHLTSPGSMKTALSQYHKGLSAEFKKITGENEAEGALEQTDLKKLAEDLPIIRIVDTLLEYAIFENASDIHIEPTENQTVVRYRVDGVLRDAMTLPKTAQAGIVARIKVLSKLKIDEHRLPQDGRFKISSAEHNIAFRVSILPVYDGEKVVLRLLNESSHLLTLEQLGFQMRALELLRQSIKKPHGIIYVTGPTGSGKTTTLYTIMNILNTPEINISTVEDPIEYRMPRVNQSQVNPKIGFTFANGLRSLLRQDPDIIMVGEIRDNETAEIAAHAAMTGHLVLSTLHTNDAPTTLPRLSEMGIPSFLIASTSNLIIAQRLVRKICMGCIHSFTLNKTAVEELRKRFDLDAILGVLEKESIIQSAKAPIESMLFYRGKGCKRCNNSGYKGRVGIYEALDVTKKMAELILINSSTEKIRQQAIADGMLTMLHDGFIKAKNGITTLEEVMRVTKE